MLSLCALSSIYKGGEREREREVGAGGRGEADLIELGILILTKMSRKDDLCGHLTKYYCN